MILADFVHCPALRSSPEQPLNMADQRNHVSKAHCHTGVTEELLCVSDLLNMPFIVEQSRVWAILVFALSRPFRHKPLLESVT
jgi:hypothetical protein